MTGKERNRKIAAAAAVLALLAAAVLAAGSSAQEHGGRSDLLQREQELRGRIAGLEREQDLLLLRKELAASDSKYLLLDLRSGRGTLCYRNRILRSFTFSALRRPPSRVVRTGALTLTGKVDGSPRRRELIFDDRLLVIGTTAAARRPGAGGTPAVLLSLPTRTVAAIFFALERDSRAVLMQ